MISIVVPVYNAQNLLAKAIDSVLQQSNANWELILVNDGSTDDSLNICTKYALQDKRIQVINQTNSGPSAARNKGISCAQGTYITFIDADDFVSPLYLEKLLAPFIESSEIDLSCAGYFELSQFHKNGLALNDFQSHLEKKSINKEDFLRNIFEGVTGVLWGKLFLNSIIKKNKILLNEQVKLSEDLLFVSKYVTFCNSIALVKDSLYFYNRLDESGLSGQLNISNLKDLQITNNELEQMGISELIPHFSSLLQKRYIHGILNITTGIANSKISIKQKIKDLNFIFCQTQESHHKGLDLNKEQKIQFMLFVKKQFLILIVFVNGINFLRNLKK